MRSIARALFVQAAPAALIALGLCALSFAGAAAAAPAALTERVTDLTGSLSADALAYLSPSSMLDER